ncbi:MAG: filamentous hemagglutinin N-terminal domain-containing protein [Symploca sp. SIO1C2]|nr:filamentous hemagglutinin N-terminal domain-containing protein [Symploca sp. SIO1C2]
MHFTKISAGIFLLGRLLVPHRTNQPPLKKGKKAHYKNFLLSWLLPLVPLLGGVRGGFLLPPVSAQIIPDNTLPGEGSHIIEGINIQGSPGDRIEGGALRGANLFHSFLEFNVLDGQQVYFANPAGIENILSRVTGNKGSDILGTLGVLGNANLFLVNPNGIVFGPNAQLDVRGSLVASTENGFNLSDGSSFSATNPEAPPLLAINVTPGIQWGNSQPQAEIVNQGNLTTGQDLNLVGSRLDLSGQLQAGRDLNLLATDTVQIRDSAHHPFIAEAAGELLVQGNQAVDIFALNHPDSGLFSGGNLVLRSANSIIGDAHYWSGGTFQIEQLDSNPGSWLSPNDPVIRANGDVSFDSYQGASLHIFAGGSVKVTGDIEITGADATNGIQETVTLSDGTTVEIDGKNEPTLDIRAGTNAVGNPGFTGNPTPINLNSTNTPNRADISIDGTIINQGGRVFLTNQYQPNPNLEGNITVKQISVPNYNPGRNGGNIHLDSKGTVDVLGGDNLGTFALGTFPAGVDQNGNMGNGGNITVLAKGNISIASELTNPGHGAINTSAFTNDANATAGNTGNVKLTSAEGNITVNGGIFNNSNANNGGISGNTGDITLQALQGEISVIGNDNGALVTATVNSNNNGNSNDNNLKNFGQTGNAGNITVQAKGNISITSELSNLFNGTIDSSAFTNTANATAGNSGGVQITSSEGNITVTGGIFTPSTAEQGGISGNTGDITLQALKGKINVTGNENGGLITTTRSNNNNDLNGIGQTGDAGNITVEAKGNISITSELTNLFNGAINASAFTNTAKATAGNSGGVQITSSDGNITVDGGILTQSIADQGGISGNTGDITLQALQGDISVTGNENGVLVTTTRNFNNINFNDLRDSGQTGDAGDITVQAQTITLNNSDNANGRKNLSLQDIINLDIPTLDIATQSSRGGKSGDITFESQNPLNLARLTIGNDANDGKVGDIEINAPSLTLDDTLITTTTFGSATAGIVDLNITNELRIINKGKITTTVNDDATGNGGTIDIAAETLELSSGAEIFAKTGKGQAGEINLNITDKVQIDDSTISTEVNPGAIGNGGSINIEARTLDLNNGAQLFATTSGTGNADQSTGNAGEINVTVTDQVKIDNSTVSTTVNGATGNGGSIEIEAGTIDLSNGAQLFAETSGLGTAGNIKLTTGLLSVMDSAQISASTSSAGKGGSLIVNANNSVTLSGDGQLSAETSGSGIAGNVEITTPTLNLNDRTQVSTTTTSTDNTGTGGNLTVRANTLNLSNAETGLLAETRGVANAGSLTLNPYSGDDIQVNLTEGAKISASTSGTGTGGSLTVNASDSVTLSGNGQLSAETSGSGIAGNVEITTPTLNLNGKTQVSTTTTSTDNTGTGGNLTVRANTLNLFGAETGLLAETRGVANAGNLSLNPHSGDDLQVNFSEGAKISASTSSTGTGGSLSVNARDSVTLSGNGQLSAEATQGGNAGGVAINTQQLSIEQGAQVAVSSNNGSGIAGDVKISATGVNLNNGRINAETDRGGISNPANISLNNVNSLSLTNNSSISASTKTGQAGSINLNQAGNPAASVSLNNSSISAQAEGEGGNAGGINLHTSQLSLEAAAQILASNVSANQGGDINLRGLEKLEVARSLISTSTQTGQAGNVTVGASESVNLSGTLTNGSGGIVAEASNGGDAGGIEINTQQLSIEQGAQVAVSSKKGSGIAGDVDISATGVNLNNGHISAETDGGGSSNPANISLNNVNSLNLTNDSSISASTQTGQAGSINLNQAGNPAASVSLNNSSISAQAEREEGNAGGINLHTSQLSLEDTAQILASNVSANQGGDITLRGLEQLEVARSLISTSTQTGQAGNVTVRASESVNLSGTLTNGSGGILAEASNGGDAGGIEINTQQLSIEQGAQVAVSSDNGSGIAGDIKLSANRVNLNNEWCHQC